MDITTLSLFAATGVGFAHAFEADHLVAVSSIVTKRDNLKAAAKDGIYWGLGHTSTIFAIGLLMIAGRVLIAEDVFRYLESVVGVMLVLLGLWRLYVVLAKEGGGHIHSEAQEGHGVSYGVGLVHGLAGSGVLVLAIMGQMQSASEGLWFLLVFGVGSMLGMLVASGIFSAPLLKRFTWAKYLYKPLSLLSALLCLGLGAYIIYENLIS